MPIRKRVFRFQIKRNISFKVGWISLRIHQTSIKLVDAQAYPPYLIVQTFRFTNLQMCRLVAAIPGTEAAVVEDWCRSCYRIEQKIAAVKATTAALTTVVLLINLLDLLNMIFCVIICLQHVDVFINV